mmetsp:Transcript_32612/g.87559  ORF Transcript_32612/g.87559 Transcript_32612/m.87559 type:complete len:293 (-) Transcript_32612:1666-2544(-)
MARLPIGNVSSLGISTSSQCSLLRPPEGGEDVATFGVSHRSSSRSSTLKVFAFKCWTPSQSSGGGCLRCATQRCANCLDGSSCTASPSSTAARTSMNSALASLNFRFWYSLNASVCFSATTLLTAASRPEALQSSSKTVVGSSRPLTATMSIGRCRTRLLVSESDTTSSVARTRVLYLELSPFSLAAKFTPSPNKPYFIRCGDPTLPASTLAVCTPQRQRTETPPICSCSFFIATLMSTADKAAFKTWLGSTQGALYTARISSPINSSSVPPSRSTTSPILSKTECMIFKTS